MRFTPQQQRDIEALLAEPPTVAEWQLTIDWRGAKPSETDALQVEQPVWTPMPPQRKFTITVRLEQQGRAEPIFFIDWVEDN